MEDIKELLFNLTLKDYHEFHLEVESKICFVFQLFNKCFDSCDPMDNLNLNRLITVSSELMLIDDPLIVNNVSDEKQRLEIKQRLTNERDVLRSTLEQLKQIGTKKAVSNFDIYDEKMNALKIIFNIK